MPVRQLQLRYRLGQGVRMVMTFFLLSSTPSTGQFMIASKLAFSTWFTRHLQTIPSYTLGVWTAVYWRDAGVAFVGLHTGSLKWLLVSHLAL